MAQKMTREIRELVSAAKKASKVLGRVDRVDAVGAKFLLDLAVYELTVKKLT